MTSVYQIANPYFESQSEFLYTALTASGTFSLVVTVLIGLASIITRFRRSKGRERQQIKWLMSGMGIMALSLSTGIVLSVGFDNHIGDVLVIMASFWPILAIGIALLRHRLYDIDVLIRRTLTYGILSAVLVLVYFGSVVVLQTVFGTLVGEQSPAVIVISTLVIAALFGTLRGRVQTIIDRRFFRQKYDAEQVLARFAQTARDEVELEALTTALLAVVDETMRPESVGVWLRYRGNREL